MKRLLALILSMLMVFGLAAGCKSEEPSVTEPGATSAPADNNPVPSDPSKEDLRVWSFSDEVANAIIRYQELNPDSIVNNFNVVPTILTDWDGSYEQAIEPALRAGGSNAPDLYMVEQAFVLKFTQGEFKDFCMPYEDLISDFGAKVTAAQLAQYAVDAGTRDGKVVGLRFQETGSCLIYRRSVAEAVWGDSSPAFVASKTGPGWTKFMEAAKEVGDAGYAMVHGDEDVWQAARDGAKRPWLVDGKLIIDDARLEYFDLAKELYDNNWVVGEGAWNDSWFNGMAGTTDPVVFSYIGPAWLINYTINEQALNGTSFGDWAVTTSPIEWAWGGTWVLANRDVEGDKKAAIAEIIEWITLDTTDDGFQFHFANGTLFKDSTRFPDKAATFAEGKAAKDAVASKVVMDKSKGDIAIVDGQDIFEYFLPAGQNARSNHWHEYDRYINGWFMDACRQYYKGEASFDEAMDWFKTQVAETYDVEVD